MHYLNAALKIGKIFFNKIDKQLKSHSHQDIYLEKNQVSTSELR
jgi:hypothetical protein